LEALFSDARVDEILINGTRGLFVSRGGPSFQEAPSPFDDALVMTRWIQELAMRQGTRLDPLEPASGGSLEQGRFRWHAVLPPISQDGPIFSLRRHRMETLTLGDFEFDDQFLTSLERLLRERRSVVVCGPTGAGKTSILAALLREYAARERVVVLEDVPEIASISTSWIRLCARRASVEGQGAITLERLLAEALRLRPDRLVVGEIRGPEAAPFLQAMLSGHDGALTTIHAGSAEEAFERLALLASQAIPEARALLRHLREQNKLAVLVMTRGCPPRARWDCL
jgi:pilus assembly protein CpaF